MDPQGKGSVLATKAVLQRDPDWLSMLRLGWLRRAGRDAIRERTELYIRKTNTKSR